MLLRARSSTAHKLMDVQFYFVNVLRVTLSDIDIVIEKKSQGK
jgi:hypothetical protein